MVDGVMQTADGGFVGLRVAGGEALAWGRRTYVMGIINATPDSFSGYGLAGDVPAIVELARRFEGEGADLLDIGAESTRPGHQPVDADDELARLLPALEAVAGCVSLPISVDTWKAPVARAALQAGAVIVNDARGLRGDSELAAVVAEYGAGLVLMHYPRPPLPAGADAVAEVIAGLRQSIAIAEAAGIPRRRLVVDPGIGFSKTADQNLALLRELGRLRELGLPLLVGTSRKSTLGRLTGLPPEQRVEATAASVALAIANGADLVRVHDVREMARVCRVSDAIVRGWRPDGWAAAQ